MAHLRVFPPEDLGNLEIGFLRTLHIDPLMTVVAETLNDRGALIGSVVATMFGLKA